MTRESAARDRESAWPGRDEQFRLVRLQSYNWGTFADVSNVEIPQAGYLFVGPSGSGKSTLLDAHTALLTPPKWVDFNVAAREAERSGKDRSVLSYVRGAWAEQTGEQGEFGVQYLRNGTTWSALAATYRNPLGRTVVLAQVLWVRGNTGAPAEVKKLYLVLQRDFDVKELKFFAESDFDVRRFKKDLPDAFVKTEFSAYQERFRGLLGIENELALRLLHKTQSAKNLGDLNSFLRDFMLDAPETFAAAERLVNEFGELNAAHQAVVAARQQIEVLSPARARHAELTQNRRDKSLLDELDAGVNAYREQRKEVLLRQRIEELGVLAEGARAETARLREIADDEQRALTHLKLRREGLAGALASLLRELAGAEEELPRRAQKREQAEGACRSLGWSMPESAPLFVELVAMAKDRLERDDALSRELEARREALKDAERPRFSEFQEVRREIDAMERQRSNIPAHMLALRAQIAQGVGISEESLPFVGELIEVKKEALAWQGAIERVLHGFALSILVEDRHHAAVSAFVNEQHLGQRLVYYRVLPQQAELRRNAGASSLIRKLRLAEVPQTAWLRAELGERFDYECAENMLAFRNAARAVTQAGQVKHGHTRHEKDDRHRVDDRRRWVLGFDNRDKLKLYRDRAGDLAAELAELAEKLQAVEDERARQRAELRFTQTLSNLTWLEVDVASLRAKIHGLKQQIASEQAARPELAELDAQIQVQEKRQRAADKARSDEEVRALGHERDCARHERTLRTLLEEAVAVRLTPTQEMGLEQRFAAGSRPLSLDTIDALATEVVRTLAEETRQLSVQMTELKNEIEGTFRVFNQRWPAESDGLDANLASAEDFFVKLTRLETDGLPRHEERFMQLLHQQSDQNLTLLSTRLELERASIRERLELVNESLLTAAFNPGTHLVIEPRDLAIEAVRQFKQSLREALSQLFVGEREVAEQRFLVLKKLVDRLKSQETEDRKWRNLVLDVRQHVEFVARELDQNGEEVEVYRSGAGKSGGQRQKLAAFCLAAALRYQLGGQDRALPSFATVALDEAFDKADAEFTTMAMNIFNTFGFQMIVATPLKSVMTLEPFIGGACFVHIKDRKVSSMLAIDYDEEAKRLKLPEQVRHGQEAPVS
jgi:uncharacterized protein YPO0396